MSMAYKYSGYTIEDIAKRLELKPTTVLWHLFHKKNHYFDVRPLKQTIGPIKSCYVFSEEEANDICNFIMKNSVKSQKEGYLTAKEVAELYGKNINTIYYHINNGTFGTVKTATDGNKTKLFSSENLEIFERNMKIGRRKPKYDKLSDAKSDIPVNSKPACIDADLLRFLVSKLDPRFDIHTQIENCRTTIDLLDQRIANLNEERNKELENIVKLEKIAELLTEGESK